MKRYLVELTEHERAALECLLAPIEQSPEDYARGLPATCSRIREKLRRAPSAEPIKSAARSLYRWLEAGEEPETPALGRDAEKIRAWLGDG